MKNSKLTFALFVSFICLLLVGAGLFFSITLTSQYLGQLKVFNDGGEKLSELTDFYKYAEKDYASQTDDETKNTSIASASFKFNGIDFVSYSIQWDEGKLEELAHELFSNVHGDEIAYVARVEVHGGDDEEYAGLERHSYEKHSLPISVNHLLPQDMSLDISTLSSVIILMGADTNTTVESMARTLSHEYGHHFTQYYFGFKGNAVDMATKYALLRGEPGSPIYSVVTDWDYYMANHMWDIQEIAAEDYVFLMGSPLAKRHFDFLDNSELVSLYASSEKEYNQYINQSPTAGNSYPHENPVLESPSQADGLAEYYYSFVDADPPEYTKLVSDYGTMDMNLSVNSDGSYTMTWTSPWPYINITYTLAAYDENDYMLRPIKTISGDEEAIAKFGMQKTIRGQREYSVDDLLDTLGRVRFRIVICFSDGSVVFSDAYDVEFQS